MSTTPTATALLVWLTPSMFALFLYGIGQGLVKQYIGEVSPARFCLYFVLAKAMVNLSWFFTHDHPPLLSTDGRPFLELGVDQDVAVESDAGHSSSPYLSSSVMVPTR